MVHEGDEPDHRAIGSAFFDADPVDEFFDLSTWVTAIIGSILILLIARLFIGRGKTSL